jgi:hypothetical protein
VTNGYVKDYTDMDFLKYTMDQTIRSRQEGKEVAVKDFIEKMPTIAIPNYVFRNAGNDRFENKNAEWGLEEKGISAGAAYVDLDNDGDLDLVVNNTNDYAGIYKNNSELFNKNNYIKIKLQGDTKNLSGIGAKVTLYCKGKKYFQEQMPVRGFQSSVDLILNFGLGSNTIIDSLLIMWPNDKIQKINNIKVNQTLTVDLKNARLNKEPIPKLVSDKYFTNTSTLNYIHKENQFNDFTVQTLLLNYLSRQGPCMAKADLNGDRREDLFIGGAAGKAGALYLQTAKGDFVFKPSSAIEADAECEDTAAEFLDIDKDGDMDLYVGSGGYEFAADNLLLQDRIYINDGKGNFSKEKTGLPKILISTGSVKSADIDRDGDTDLFIGGRLVPGAYPSAPESRILINDGRGNYTDVTNAMTPAIRNLGMVTDALWIDLNDDNFQDLIVVGEWMPVKIFLNRKGKLTDASDTYIKFASTGWWNRIYADDMDGDGDKDIIIGNLGLNAQFGASKKEPLTLYFKDFDSNGSIDPIFCYYIKGISYPAASRDDLMDQLPGLKKKFLKYDTYSTATIKDLFSSDQLKDVKVLKAEILETVYLENTGNGLKLIPLPVEAQYAPVYAIASADADRDGKKDLILAGNNSWTRIKFGQFTSSNGMLLTGNGHGNFSYVPQWKSGLNIQGNVRSLQVIVSEGNAGNQFIFGINNSRIKTLIN